MDSVEFSGWQAYAQVNPVDKIDLYFAQLTAMILNVNLKKGAEPFGIADFLLFHEPPEPIETEEERQTRIAISIERTFANVAKTVR